MRRPGIEPESGVLVPVGRWARLTGFNPLRRCLSLAFGTCAVRELNPGYWLGKPMSYHWTNGAHTTCAPLHIGPPYLKIALQTDTGPAGQNRTFVHRVWKGRGY